MTAMLAPVLTLRTSGRRTLVQQALAILARYGSAANLYLPGVGAINGIAAGNGLDSAGTTAATVDNPVGRADNARGGAHLTQATTANKPVLRLSGGVYAWDFVSSDSFTSTMTPGNAGFFCSVANVTDSGVLRTLLGAGAGSDASSGVLRTLLGVGAGSDASSGVWLARDASNALTLQVGNGTTRNSVSAAYPVATNAVASAGWDASNMFVGINGTETSGAKTVDCTSSNTINLGVLTGTTNPMLGTIGATIIMPTVLPTPAERAVLRRFIGSLSGVTL